MNNRNKTYEELTKEVKALRMERNELISTFEKDITARKKVEEELHISAERYRKAQAVGKVGSWEYDIKNDTFWGSDEGKRVYGFNLETDIFTAEEVMKCVIDRDRVDQALIDLIEKNEPYNIEFEIIPRNSSEKKTIHSIAELVRDAKGHPVKVTGVLHDITDRKKSEEDLNKYRVLLESSLESQKDTILFSIDRNYRYLYFNKAHSDVMKYAYDKEVKIGMNILDCITTDDDRKAAKENYDRALNGESHSNVRIFGDVHLAYYESFFNPIVNENNEIIGATGLARNITERKNMEDQLLLLNEAIESTSDAIVISDVEGHHFYQNRAFSELFGYTSLEEFEAVGGTKAIVKDPAVPKEIFQHIMNGKSYSGELEMVKKSGEVFPAYERTDVIKDSDGKMIGLIGIITDISERKKAEAKLLESEERFRALFESAKDGILQMTLSGEIVALNESFAVMHGFTMDEMVKMNIRDLVTPETSRLFPERMQKLVNGESILYEVDHYCKDGRLIPIEVSANLVTVGSHQYVLGFNRDITLRKQTEEGIRLQNTELARLNAEKDKFFSIIAHDLRNPFNSFLGLTQIMAEELQTMTLEQIQKIAVSMKKSATNLYNLLENLLEWSRLQQGLSIYEPDSLLLKPRIAESLALYLEAFQSKKIDIHYDIPENQVVFADDNMLGSIIRNLVSNAVKFTPSEGQVTIASKQDSAGWVEIFVKDTGIGMTKEIKEGLFNVGVNSNRRGTNNEPSTGLGLILCKEFVEKHGGRIWADSEEGKGSTFYFTVHAGQIQ